MTDTTDSSSLILTHRIAEESDIEAIRQLMQASIAENMKAFLSASEIEAAKETMGVDKTLIEDGTYFLIETILRGRNRFWWAAEAGANARPCMAATIP